MQYLYLYLTLGWAVSMIECMTYGLRFRCMPVILILWPIWVHMEIRDWLYRRTHRYE